MSNLDVHFSATEPQLYCRWIARDELQQLITRSEMNYWHKSKALDRLSDPLYFEYRWIDPPVNIELETTHSDNSAVASCGFFYFIRRHE